MSPNSQYYEEFIDDYGVTFKVLLDKDSVVSTKYGIQPIPTTYMIDSNGIIHVKISD